MAASEFLTVRKKVYSDNDETFKKDHGGIDYKGMHV